VRAEDAVREAERPDDVVRPELEAARRPVEEARPAILLTVVVWTLFNRAPRRNTDEVREQ
jgi:hypothetical protein